jgi:hypothetical protein
MTADIIRYEGPRDLENIGFGEQWNREVSEAHLRCYVREVCPRM